MLGGVILLVALNTLKFNDLTMTIIDFEVVLVTSAFGLVPTFRGVQYGSVLVQKKGISAYRLKERWKSCFVITLQLFSKIKMARTFFFFVVLCHNNRPALNLVTYKRK